jgi:PAS domain S-box-containing protein
VSISSQTRHSGIISVPGRVQAMIYAFSAGMVFVVTALVISLIHEKLEITITNILRVHLLNPLLFFLYSIPFFFIIVVYYFLKIREHDLSAFEEEIAKKDATINKNASFAKEIGQGNYNISIEPEGNYDILGKSLLVMRENLLANHTREKEQNWISEGKNTVSNILRLYNKLEDLGDHVLEHLVIYIEAIQGAIYLYNEDDKKLVNLSIYAYNRKKHLQKEYRIGYGLIGQCAYEKEYIYRTEIPDDYFTITSGVLGDKKPSSLLLMPLISEDQLQGVIELASFREKIPSLTITLVKELANIIARTIYNLRINQKTERLLEESQKMTLELRENEEKLRQNAKIMQSTQEELRKTNVQLEMKITEVENARQLLHRLLENASEIISIYNKDTQMVYISPSVVNILGYTVEEMIKGKSFERLSLHGQTGLASLLEQVRENPELSPTARYTFVRKDGQIVFLETTARNRLEDPAINGIILNSRDITEKYRAEKEERMRTRMQSLSENSLDLIIRLNLEGRFYYVNPVAEDYTRIHSNDMINKNLSDINLPESLRDYFREIISDIRNKPHKSNTLLTIPVLMGEKQSVRMMSIDAIPEFSDHELETILFIGHDITEAKRIEQELQIKNKKIEDSINYAQRIQSSILPGIKQIQRYFPKSFIYYKPRDVISGDFPWFFPKSDVIYLSAVDCTGHGVPGALLSFIGYFLLNNLVDREKDYTAGEICELLHQGVRYTLKQNTEYADARDGMDIAFLKIMPGSKELHYCGAHRPLYFIHDDQLIEYKGDRKAIGGIPNRKRPEVPFTNHVIHYKPGDKIFFFTDGLPDQLGGPEINKYSPSRIREIIKGNLSFTMTQYRNYFIKDFEEWMGKFKQIDDVLIIGIEF